ncbi:MAG: ATP-binding protein [bacterium]
MVKRKEIKKQMEKKVNLGNKIITTIILIVLFFGLIITFIINQILPQALKNETKKIGITIAKNLANRSVIPILEKNFVILKYMVDEEKESNKDVVYAFVVNWKKEVVAHTFEKEFPVELKDANLVFFNQINNICLLDTEKGFIYDIAVPIIIKDERFGIVRIGITNKNIQKTINTFLGIIIGTVVIAIMMSVFVGLILTKTIVKPIKELHHATEEILKGNLDIKVNVPLIPCWEMKKCEKKECPAYGKGDSPCWYIVGTMCDKVVQGTYAKKTGDCKKCEVYQEYSGDEVQQLGETFNIMVANIKNAKTELEKKIIERTNELQKSENRFKDIAFSLVDWIWEVDEKGVYTYCSMKIKDILGYTEEEIIGKTPFDLMPPMEAEKIGKIFSEIVKNKKPIKDLENLNLSKDGRQVYFLTNGVPILDERGNLKGYRGVDKDITERKQAEVELKTHTETLESVNKELDSFVYTASHDLKEPLRGIDTFSQFILEDYSDKLDDTGKDYLKRISASINRMQNLIDDLLALSRISRIKNPYTSVDSGNLVKSVIKRLKYFVEEKNVKIEIDDELPFIFCDEVKIKEVFYNLILNAIKYNNKSNPEIEIGVVVNNQIPTTEHQFFIRDNGIGIPKEHFETIFQIFKRLHARDEYGGGTGAGLAIVKKIIDEHNGKIWLKSEESKGTTFFFTISKKEKN